MNKKTAETITLVDDLGFIKIEGPDAKKFLQGQLTCHMDLINDLTNGMGAYCSPQGRVINVFYIFMHEQAYYLLTPKNMITPTIAALKKYAVFFKASLADASESMTAIGCNNLDVSTLHLEHTNLITIPNNQHRHILAGKTAITTSHWNSLSQTHNRASPDAWKQYDIEDCIPRITPETSGKFLAHDINLDKLNALSFDKGCYTGQEIIARMHYKSKLKNRLHHARVSCDATLLAGMDIYVSDNSITKVCGTIVNAMHEGDRHYHILFISDEANANNHTFYLSADTTSPICIIN